MNNGELQNLVNLFKSRKLSKAKALNEKLIKDYPKNVFLYNFISIILIEEKKLEEAINYINQGIEININYAPLYDNLGSIYKLKKNYSESEKYYNKSISLDKNSPEPHNNLGNLYNIINRHNDAIKSYKNAIKINPNFFISHYNLGTIYKSLGMFKEASYHLKKSIELNNFIFSAHRSLSSLIKYTDENKHYLMLKDLYENKKIRNSELIFSLAKANEDLKLYDKAFDYYQEGNNLRKKEIIFSIEDEKIKFNNLKKIYNKKLFTKLKNSGYNNDKVIFILGLPRSGTTLIEQILSSHKDVFAGDELDFLPNLAKSYIEKENIDKIDFATLKNLGKNYISKINLLSSNSKKVTDKLPINFQWIGLIKLILPKASIIHCIRNPKDNCFSIYKNYFPNKNLNFAYNLEDIIGYYNIYNDIMKYWKKVLPNFIIDVSYEKLVTNPKNEIKNLVKKCNLKWDVNCLNFHKNKRLIKTTSDTQARKKIYKSSINSWKCYKKRINKYFDKLN